MPWRKNPIHIVPHLQVPVPCQDPLLHDILQTSQMAPACPHISLGSTRAAHQEYLCLQRLQESVRWPCSPSLDPKSGQSAILSVLTQLRPPEAISSLTCSPQILGRYLGAHREQSCPQKPWEADRNTHMSDHTAMTPGTAKQPFLSGLVSWCLGKMPGGPTHPCMALRSN